jgi:hypothetical protein
MTRTATGPKPAKVKREFDSQNAKIAALIVAEPWKFGGTSGFAYCWAKLFQARMANQQKLRRPGQAA